jgi:hypothetical protein
MFCLPGITLKKCGFILYAVLIYEKIFLNIIFCKYFNAKSINSDYFSILMFI